MKLKNGKTYIDGLGRRVRIVATDRLTAATEQPAFPIVGLLDCGRYEDTCTFTREGRCDRVPTDYDLVQEVGQYDHIRKGDVVRHVFNGELQLAHFYGIDSDGTPRVYAGFTSPWVAGLSPPTLRAKHVELVKALNLDLD